MDCRGASGHAQLFIWRREMLQAMEVAATSPASVPAVSEPVPRLVLPEPPPAPKRRRTRRSRSSGTAVEPEIDGVAVRIAQGADAKTLR